MGECAPIIPFESIPEPQGGVSRFPDSAVVTNFEQPSLSMREASKARVWSCEESEFPPSSFFKPDVLDLL
jgi:hypothetical protein